MGGAPVGQWYGPHPPQMGAQSGQAPIISQDQSAGGSDSQISGKSQGKNQQKTRQDIQKTAPAPASGLMAYSEVICYNCGEPGHHLDKCVKPKSCFICKMVTRKVENCPIRGKTHSSARYVGSAAPRLCPPLIECSVTQN